VVRIKSDFSEHPRAQEGRSIEVPSSTTPGKTYIVTVGKHGVSCSCPGWEYRKTCKHVLNVPLAG
jgi:hypothetical protein